MSGPNGEDADNMLIETLPKPVPQGGIDVLVHLTPKLNPISAFSTRVTTANKDYEVPLIDGEGMPFPVVVRVEKWKTDGNDTTVLRVPPARSIDDVLKAAAAHQTSHPGHGYNCACMDNLIREARALLRGVVTSDDEKIAHGQADRVFWVLMTALKRV